jgi:hypothetical protein
MGIVTGGISGEEFQFVRLRVAGCATIADKHISRIPIASHRPAANVLSGGSGEHKTEFINLVGFSAFYLRIIRASSGLSR